MADLLSNPFDSRQIESKEKTIKWCAWEVLKQGKELSEDDIVTAILAQNLRSEVKVPSVFKQLSGDRNFVKRPGGWALAPVRSSHTALGASDKPESNHGPHLVQDQKKKRSREVGFDDLDEQLLPMGGRRRNPTKKDWWKVDDDGNEIEEEECGDDCTEQDDEKSMIEHYDISMEKDTAGEERIVGDEGEQGAEEKLDELATTTVGAGAGAGSGAELGADAEKATSAAGENDLHKTQTKEELEAPVVEAPGVAPAGSKPFVIPKRGNIVPPAAAAASSPERPHHDTKESKKSPKSPSDLSTKIPINPSRAPRSLADRERHERSTSGKAVDVRQQKPRAEPPPQPIAPSLREALESMMRQNKGALASAMGRLRWPQGGPTLLLPAPEGSVTGEQREEWSHIRNKLACGSSGACSDRAVHLPQNEKAGLPVQDLCPPLPNGLVAVRLMQCSANTEQLSLERLVFASNSKLDIDGIDPGKTMILLHNFDKKCVYGCYRAVRVGRSLDSKFSREWSYQVRVERLQEFSPLPAELLEPFIPRRINQKDGKAMKFLEKGTPLVREVWQLFALCSGKGFY